MIDNYPIIDFSTLTEEQMRVVSVMTRIYRRGNDRPGVNGWTDQQKILASDYVLYLLEGTTSVT